MNYHLFHNPEAGVDEPASTIELHCWLFKLAFVSLRVFKLSVTIFAHILGTLEITSSASWLEQGSCDFTRGTCSIRVESVIVGSDYIERNAALPPTLVLARQANGELPDALLPISNSSFDWFQIRSSNIVEDAKKTSDPTADAKCFICSAVKLTVRWFNLIFLGGWDQKIHSTNLLPTDWDSICSENTQFEGGHKRCTFSWYANQPVTGANFEKRTHLTSIVLAMDSNSNQPNSVEVWSG